MRRLTVVVVEVVDAVAVLQGTREWRWENEASRCTRAGESAASNARVWFDRWRDARRGVCIREEGGGASLLLGATGERAMGS